MLYKKFELVRNQLEAKNFTLAKKLLDELNTTQMNKSARDLLEALYLRLPEQVTILSSNEFNPLEVKYLSDLDEQEVNHGISIVSCCMNRNENLLKALKTWVQLPVNEIVIVDWSSTELVSETIKHIEDDRIRVLRVNGEQKWILTYGFNVGLRFASFSTVFKLDADIEVSPNFLELNTFSAQQFIRGYWKSALDEGLDSQVYVNGSFGAHKKHLKEIGYYNELIRTYGWDDSDIYERLASQCGLGTKFLGFRSVLHLEQDEAERTAYQDVATANYLGRIPPTEFNNQRNKFIGRTTDYWNTSRLQNYSMEQLNSNLYQLNRVSFPINIPTHIIDDANKYAAIHFLWANRPELISKSCSQTDLAHFLIKEYNAEINFEITQVLLGEIHCNHIICSFDTTECSFKKFLQQCLEISNREQTTVYAIALGKQYSHKRIGDLGQFVEVLSLTNDFVSIISSLREVNKLSSIRVENLTSVDDKTFEEDVLSVFKPKVYVDAQHGLGNRIRAIGSAAAIAKKTGRELVIVWEADHHCECEFSDLFVYEGQVINRSFVKDADKYMDLYNYMEIEAGSCKDKLIEPNYEKHLYLRAAYTFNSPLSDWDSENVFIRSLKPTAEIQALINGFDLSNAISAHVRMEAGAGRDHNTYDSIENWTQEGHDQLHFWREKSHYSRFIKRIDEIFKSDAETKLFLATDLPENYEVFIEYYGERLVFLKRETYDRSKEQIKYALADALLLSRAKMLLGSTWSSFSELAMRLSTTYSEIEMSGRDF